MLALDALSGRRLIAGTIPAFDRWTLAETPTEDARLHDVFVRALHPDPDQRYPSLEAWFAALAGPEREAESGALSRFAREGVILAAPAADRGGGREIKVQATRGSRRRGAVAVPRGGRHGREPRRREPGAHGDGPRRRQLPEPRPNRNGWWPTCRTKRPRSSPKPSRSRCGTRRAPDAVHDAPARRAAGPEWRFDEPDGATVQSEPPRSWDTAGEDDPEPAAVADASS